MRTMFSGSLTKNSLLNIFSAGSYTERWSTGARACTGGLPEQLGAYCQQLSMSEQAKQYVAVSKTPVLCLSTAIWRRHHGLPVPGRSCCGNICINTVADSDSQVALPAHTDAYYVYAAVRCPTHEVEYFYHIYCHLASLVQTAWCI